MTTGVDGVDFEVHELPVDLPAFSGPLDLLLHLIQKNEVSIYDIPIARICDQYHDILRAMQEIDLELAGEFLWMASWLLQLKSKMLLPAPRDDEEDPRQELVERLLEYRRVKELAAVLYEKDVVRRCLWEPSVSTDIEKEEDGFDLDDLDLRALARTYLRVMERFASSHPPPLRLLPLRFRVEDKMAEIYARVTDEGTLPLLSHLHSRPDPEEVVTLVVAVLELVRLGGVAVTQRRAFAEIDLKPGPNTLDAATLRQPEAVRGS